MKQLKRLVVISRPILWAVFAATYWWGVVSSGSKLNDFTGLGLIFITFVMSLMVMGINDIADREFDQHNPRKGRNEGAVINIAEVKLVSYSIILIMAACVIPLAIYGRWRSLACVAFISIFALAYSLKPVRLKSRPILDLLSNGLWLAAVFLFGYFITNQQSSINLLAWRQIAVSFCLGFIFHSFGALLDYTADKADGQLTIATWLGRRRVAILSTAILITAFGLSYHISFSLRILLSISLVMALIVCVWPVDRLVFKFKTIFYYGLAIPLPLIYVLWNLW